MNLRTGFILETLVIISKNENKIKLTVLQLRRTKPKLKFSQLEHLRQKLELKISIKKTWSFKVA